MDFYQIKERIGKHDVIEIYPDFIVGRSKDLMVRGKAFYAIWDEEKGLWSTDEFDVQRLIDKDLESYYEDHKDMGVYKVRWMSSSSSKSWKEYREYVKNLPDNYHQLDEFITFANEEVKKDDYRSKHLPYGIVRCDENNGEIGARSYEEIIGTLYDDDERRKIEWAIGSIFSGDARWIQKFLVFYGSAGAGKSTILNIIDKLFEGYTAKFDAKALTGSSNAFATEAFRDNPLVAIQHDGDLSKIEDNTKLNSIVSHEDMIMNEKYKSSYVSRVNCFLFMGTNKPVKITDSKSGVIRRLIDVRPNGNRIPPTRYHELMRQVNFELGEIARHCIEVYEECGPNYYSDYKPLDMIYKTDVFFNFVENYYDEFAKDNGITLKRAYDLYKAYCEDSLVEYKLARYKFREELKNYFADFHERVRIGEEQYRSYYSGFLTSKFESSITEKEFGYHGWIDLKEQPSLFDQMAKDYPAQEANQYETPSRSWDSVTSTLSEIDTRRLHFVKVPKHHIVIDFDIRDHTGEKSLILNLEAATKWPETYVETSKSGQGLHLHYIYDGDVDELSRVYTDDIEIKVYNGNASLRRKLVKCNNIAVATLTTLAASIMKIPQRKKKGDKMVDFTAAMNNDSIHREIQRNLNKEIHKDTTSSIHMIDKILNDAYEAGVVYDARDLREKILKFAMHSTNQAQHCTEVVTQMKFRSEVESEPKSVTVDPPDERIVFFDFEVFPNVIFLNWKYEYDDNMQRIINPTPEYIEWFMTLLLGGFNCRRYDNHIMYKIYMGASIKEVYEYSQKIIKSARDWLNRDAYNASYIDIYDMSSKKQGLKKWEIELGLPHVELGLPWDEPVPEELWPKVSSYCDNDVISTEAVFHHNKGDWITRNILSKLSGLPVNETNNNHSKRIIFGNNRHPQNEFIYTDLSKEFPGYTFKNGVSTYRGIVTGEGGLVIAEPGMYYNLAVLDIASAHPTNIRILRCFGPYTDRYNDITDARLAIKHQDREALETLLDGAILPFYDEVMSGNADYTLDDLAFALKMVINPVYGLSSAKFENEFKDPRNVDNIVAKRTALFMVDLLYAVQEKGFQIVHIKTDSVKIPNATPEIIEFVIEFGKKYGFTIEHECTYEKMCLVNKSVYIAKYDDQGVRNKGGKHAMEWTPTGAQFAHPYVLKYLFTKEPITDVDKRETKSSKVGDMYLDMNEGLPEEDHNYVFVGKVGQFYPVRPGCGGGKLVAKRNDDSYAAVTGTKDYRWKEVEVVEMNKETEIIDDDYFRDLVDDAIENISKYGDFEKFISDEIPFMNEPDDENPPWSVPCGDRKYESCLDCPKSRDNVTGTLWKKCAAGYDISKELCLPFD